MARNKGIGCKKCPVKDCAGSYRGSSCAAAREKVGLGDPLTNFERIKAMGIEEMASVLNFIAQIEVCINPKADCCSECSIHEICTLINKEDCIEWLESEVRDGKRQ